MAKITEKSVEQKIADVKRKLVADMEEISGPSDGPVDDVMKIVLPMIKDLLSVIEALNEEVKSKASNGDMMSQTDPRLSSSHHEPHEAGH